jgi:hypothetical protein
MPEKDTSPEGHTDHSQSAAGAAGDAVFRDYGPQICWRDMRAMLQDRRHVRFPCEIKFDSALLLPGECAHTVPRGARPEEGYSICVHPHFFSELSAVPFLALLQVWFINHGSAATLDDAEVFGSRALGIPLEVYYGKLCELASALAGDELC